MQDMTGKEIGRYQFRERLGAGGMAMVYKAYDIRLEREVAIKIIQTDVFAPNVLAEVLQRFEREAKALARLNHPHIVKVYDFGEFDGLPYLVMEFHPGGTLKRYTDRQQPFFEAARLLAPVAQALDYAHQRSILHRDVKPSNILMNENNQPMLTDFGIAKILEVGSNTGLTASGVGIGTPEYIAPEQGVGRGVDARSDIYSLGIVLYELVTGRRPFTADTPMAVILEHVTRPLPSPRDYVSDLPDDVVGVLYTALAKLPEDRYPNMGVFASALEQLASERPTARSVSQATTLTQPGQAGAPYVERTASPLQDRQAVSPSHKADTPPPIIQPTLQAPVPTQYDVGQASGTSHVERTISPFEDRRADSPTGPPSFIRQAVAPTERPKRGGNALLAAGAVLVFAVLAVVGGLLLRGPGATPTPTQPIQAAAPAVSATALAQLPPTRSPTTTSTLPPSATITPLPSPTPLPQFISDAFDRPLALIPAGEFNLGSLDSDLAASQNERPQHTLTSAAFYLDVHEATNADYAQCVEAGACQPPANFGSSTSASYYDNPEFASYPVIFVSWPAARDYCQWRNARLPTEAEWEKAARGGLPDLPYPWGDQPPTCESQAANGANYSQCPYSGPVPVGGFAPNPYGLYDMAGNVWEWTSSLSRPYPYNPVDGREDPKPVELRVLRGGSWDAEAASLRSVARRSLNQNAVDNGVGFRCVVDIAVITRGEAPPAGSQSGATGAASATPAADQPNAAGLTPLPTATRTPTRGATATLPTRLTFTPTPTIGTLIKTRTPTPTTPPKFSPTPTTGLILKTRTPTPTPFFKFTPTNTPFIKLPTPTPTSYIKPPTPTNTPRPVSPTDTPVPPTKTPVPPTDTPPPPTNTPVPPTNTPRPPPTNTPVPQKDPYIKSPGDGDTYGALDKIDFCFYTGLNVGSAAAEMFLDGKSSGKGGVGNDQMVCDSGNPGSGSHEFGVIIYNSKGSQIWSGSVKFAVK